MYVVRFHARALAGSSSYGALVGELEFIAVLFSHGPVALLLFLLGPHIQPQAAFVDPLAQIA